MNNNELRMMEEAISSITNTYEKELANTYLQLLFELKAKISDVYEKYAIDGIVPRESWYRYGYLRVIEKELVEKINELTPIQNEIIEKQITEVYQETYYRNAFSVTQAALLSTTIFALLKKKEIANVLFNKHDKKKWTQRNKANNRQLSSQLMGIIQEGIRKGLPYEKTAKLITQRMNIGRDRAIKIAQTETGRVREQANYDVMQRAKENGVIMKKRWVSTLDSRTRKDHRKLDGQIVGMDDYFVIDGKKALHPKDFGVAEHDINCRCTMISVFEGVEPSVRMARERDGVMGELTNYRTYDEWHKSLK